MSLNTTHKNLQKKSDIASSDLAPRANPEKNLDPAPHGGNFDERSGSAPHVSNLDRRSDPVSHSSNLDKKPDLASHIDIPEKSFDKTPRLIICPTPIGNLGDVTERALQALTHSDVIFAEDTRVTGKLLRALRIKNRIERLDEATMNTRAKSVIAHVRAGEVVTYCSDAGMPGVSDPGLRLVALAREAGVRVEVLPGASALTCAYVSSGFACPRFYFHGFFPRRANEQMFLLEQLKALDACLIFYESPRRLVRTMQAIAHELPNRHVCVCRELTKLHEEVVVGVTGEVACAFADREARNGNIKGEIVIVVDAPSDVERDSVAQDSKKKARVLARARAQVLIAQGTRPKEIAKQLMREFNVSRNVAYEIALEARG